MDAPELLPEALEEDLDESGGAFQRLLKRVAEEHDKEVSALREKITLLQGAEIATASASVTAEPVAQGHKEEDLARSTLFTQFSSATRRAEDEADERSVFAPKPAWAISEEEASMSVGGPPPSPRRQPSYNRQGSADDPEAEEKPFLNRLVVAPGSVKRTCWDIFGCFLLLYDIIMIPMAVFEPAETPTMDWITLVFWSCDMVASLFVGFHQDGVVVMEPELIARNYIKTWFLVDLIVVGPDWVFTILSMTEGKTSGSSGFVKFLPVLRVVRTVRLLRLLKLKRLMTWVQDRLDSEYITIVVNMVKLVGLMISVNHFLGCAWWGIARLTSPESWIDVYTFDVEPMAYQYITSLHWSLTQFTPGSMHVQPQNLAERIFAVTVLIAGMIVFSSFVSSITSSMTQLRQLESDHTNQYWLLRKYLRQRQVPNALTSRIYRYVEFASKSQKDIVPEAKVKLLPLLSEQLKEELQMALIAPTLKNVPVFGLITSISDVATQRIIWNTMTQRSLACGDSLFFAGEHAKRMACVVSGVLSYKRPLVNLQERKAVFQDDGGSTTVLAGCWASEAVLWTEWDHRGDMMAQDEAQLVLIAADKFMDICVGFRSLMGPLQRYATAFVVWLNSTKPCDLTDVFREEARKTLKDIIEAKPTKSRYPWSSDARREAVKQSVRNWSRVCPGE